MNEILFINRRLLNINLLIVESDIGKEDGEFLFIGLIDMDVIMSNIKFVVDIFEIRRDVIEGVDSMVVEGIE